MDEIEHEGYTVRMADRNDRSGFIELHHLVFGSWNDSIADDVFGWKYINNPYIDELPIVVVTKDGEVVGATGYTAFEMYVDGSERLGLQSGDLMVHPDHRRTGLFSKMNELTIEHYNDRQVLFFSFPARDPREGYVNFGWERVRNPQFVQFSGVRGDPIGWPPDPKNLAKAAYYRLFDIYLTGIRTIQPEGDQFRIEKRVRVPIRELVDLYERRKPTGVHALRSSEFYQWRLASPLYDTTTYLAKANDESVAAVVVDENEQRTVLREILPYTGGNEALRSILSQVTTDYPNRELVVWPHESHKLEFYRSGYVPKGITPRLRDAPDLVVKDTAEGSDVVEPRNWMVQLSERDY